MTPERAIDLKFPPELMRLLKKAEGALGKVDNALSKVEEFPRLLQAAVEVAWWDGFYTGALTATAVLLSLAVLVLLARAR